MAKNDRIRLINKESHNCSSNTPNPLQIYYNGETGKYTGFCFSCNTFDPDPYGDEKIDEPKARYREETVEVCI